MYKLLALSALAQWALPQLLPPFRRPGAGEGAQDQKTSGLRGVEARLDPATKAGLERALREATPKALDGFELELLRNNCPRAALLCRARASELRAQESQKAQALALSEAQRKMIADQVQAGVKAELEKMRVKMSEAQAKKQPAKATNEMPQAPASPSLPVLQNGAPPLAPDLATAVLQASASMSGVKVPGA